MLVSGKIEIPVKDAHRLINAGPVVLVASQYGGKATISTVAWHMPVSSWPKLVAVSLALKRFTLELLEQSESFSINIPVFSQLKQVTFCGTYSGRNVDKLAEAGYTTRPCSSINSFFLDECVAHMECSVQSITETGDHKIVVGEVKSVFADENLFNEQGVIDINRVHLIHHLGSTHFGILHRSDDGEE
jgi:flavin reductase (DIM6/NTAB) family NADH-FMN oxidoreductase RutF